MMLVVCVLHSFFVGCCVLDAGHNVICTAVAHTMGGISTDAGMCCGLSFLGNAESPRNLQLTQVERKEFGIYKTLTNSLLLSSGGLKGGPCFCQTGFIRKNRPQQKWPLDSLARYVTLSSAVARMITQLLRPSSTSSFRFLKILSRAA